MTTHQRAHWGALLRTAFIATALVASAIPAWAQVNRNGQSLVYDGVTITLSTPLTRGDCRPTGMQDTVYTTGVPGDWQVRGQINVGYMAGTVAAPVFVITQSIPVDTYGNISVTINYPPHSAITVNAEGNIEYHVEPQLEVFKNGIKVLTLGPGQDWDVYCNEPPPPPPPPPGNLAGCTPGYWKVSQHFDSWPAPIVPQTSFEGVFGSIPGNDVSFLSALQGGGGPGIDGALSILRRAAAAAYLNALKPDHVLNYGHAPEMVIAYVNQYANSNNRDQILWLAGVLDALNNRGCPLN